MIKRILSVVAVVVMLAGYMIFLHFYTSEENNTAPVIEFDSPHLELSVTDDQSKLLEGVHAYDEEDGDLSDEIIIDSISEFDRENNRTVKYVVFDRSNKAVSAERTISYVDYTAPSFQLTGSLVMDSLTTSKLNKLVEAQSSVDGDISANVDVKAGAFENNAVKVDVSVRDSTGTESTLSFTCDYDRNIYASSIVLNNYLLYANAGGKPDLYANISDILVGNQSNMNLLPQVTIQESVDVNQPGVYDVYYYLNGNSGITARTKAIVVVQ